MSQAVRVGIFMTIALVVLAYLILKVEDLTLFGEPGTRVEARFPSVAGLDDKSAVRVAGVRVGRVDGIRLEGREAIVTLLLETPVALTAEASATIANVGLLGDKYVVLDPGPPGAPPLPEGAVLPGVTPVTFDEAMSKVNELGASIGQAVGSLTGENENTTLARLLANLEATSAEIRILVADNRRQIGATVDHFSDFSGTLAAELPVLSDKLGRVLDQVEGILAENRGEVREGLSQARQATEQIRTSIENLNRITDKIAKGEGTIGKLVHSDATHDQLVSTLASLETGVDSLGETFGKIQKVKLDLGFNSYYLDGPDEFRTGFDITIDPQSRRFYYLGVVDDPRGRVRSKTDVITVTADDGSTETTTVRRVTTEDELTLTAQVGFRFDSGQIRAGVIEGTGGAGLDWSLLNKRLEFSLEAFDFGREGDLAPRLRFTSRWHATPNIYLMGGLDDALESRRDAIFLGAGVRWNDDDLKYLLGSVPRF